MSTAISIKKCKTGLAALWFTGSLGVFLILVIQSVLGKYGERVDEAWGWFLPIVMPTLSLMVGVLVVDAVAPSEKADDKTGWFMFGLATVLSTVYLVLVALVPLIQPFTNVPTLDLMRRSNLWLGPLQGLVAGALGAFFIKGERRTK